MELIDKNVLELDLLVECNRETNDDVRYGINRESYFIERLPIIDIDHELKEFYVEAEKEYQAINDLSFPDDDKLTYADGYREAAYAAWELARKISKGGVG